MREEQLLKAVVTSTSAAGEDVGMSAICIRRGGLESDAAGDAQVEGATGREEGEDACECKGARRVRQASRAVLEQIT